MPKDWALAASRAGAGPAAGHATGGTLAVPWDMGLGHRGVLSAWLSLGSLSC